MFPTAFPFGFTARFWSCVIRKSSNVFHIADAAAAWEAVGTALVRCEQWVGVGVLGMPTMLPPQRMRMRWTAAVFSCGIDIMEKDLRY